MNFLQLNNNIYIFIYIYFVEAKIIKKIQEGKFVNINLDKFYGFGAKEHWCETTAYCRHDHLKRGSEFYI